MCKGGEWGREKEDERARECAKSNVRQGECVAKRTDEREKLESAVLHVAGHSQRLQNTATHYKKLGKCRHRVADHFKCTATY